MHLHLRSPPELCAYRPSMSHRQQGFGSCDNPLGESARNGSICAGEARCAPLAAGDFRVRLGPDSVFRGVDSETSAALRLSRDASTQNGEDIRVQVVPQVILFAARSRTPEHLGRHGGIVAPASDLLAGAKRRDQDAAAAWVARVADLPQNGPSALAARRAARTGARAPRGPAVRAGDRSQRIAVAPVCWSVFVQAGVGLTHLRVRKRRERREPHEPRHPYAAHLHHLRAPASQAAAARQPHAPRPAVAAKPNPFPNVAHVTRNTIHCAATWRCARCPASRRGPASTGTAPPPTHSPRRSAGQ